MHEPIDYVELPGGELAATKAFYADAFGWGFVDYGPAYAALDGAGLDGGFAAETPAGTAPLVILRSDDLETTRGHRGGRRRRRADLRLPRRPPVPLPRPCRQRARRLVAGRMSERKRASLRVSEAIDDFERANHRARSSAHWCTGEASNTWHVVTVHQ